MNLRLRILLLVIRHWKTGLSERIWKSYDGVLEPSDKFKAP
jgi:hypothetical protein